MDADRNLLPGVCALQAGWIDCQQFLEVFALWTGHQHAPLIDLLIERGYLRPADKEHLEYLARRTATPRAEPARVGGGKDSATGRDALDLRGLLGEAPQTGHSLLGETIAYSSQTQERYSLGELHATGGIGRVWLARDGHLGREVALKELRPDHADNSTARARFLNEAQITGQLEHPGIVPVYELDVRPGDKQPFYTMRFVRGQTLKEAAQKHQHKRQAGQDDPLELLKLLNAFVAVANTVAYAHSRGVLHRDLKGQNVVVGQFGEVVVLDWGLAKVITLPDEERELPAVTVEPCGNESADLTLQGQAVGTPAYMAPEQAAGRLDLVDCFSRPATRGTVVRGSTPFPRWPAAARLLSR